MAGSKNAVKGAGFFLRAALLGGLGFVPAQWMMAGGLTLVPPAILGFLPAGLAARDAGARFAHVSARAPAVSRPALARLFLFAARDVWSVVALPVWLMATLTRDMPPERAFFATGAFMAFWIIGNGAMHVAAPRLADGSVARAVVWALALGRLTTLLAAVARAPPRAVWPVLAGLVLFGGAFAVNSTVQSLLILDVTEAGRVTMEVGFCYMANACGWRLGTVLSGLTCQAGRLLLALAVSSGLSGRCWRGCRADPASPHAVVGCPAAGSAPLLPPRSRSLHQRPDARLPPPPPDRPAA